MSIIGQNALLNQYVPTIYIKDLLDGQILKYDSTRRAFVNAVGGGGSGANKLGELLNVSPTVDSPSPSLANGQALIYNSFTSLWENQYIGGGSGTAGQVLISNGAGFTPTWQTVSGSGSVTSVSVVTANGVSGSVANPTTTPAITLVLGAITPTSISTAGSITAAGAINGSNLSGTNTGNQVITLSGDATNSNTSTGGVLTLTTVNANVGTFGSATQVPVFTVDAKGRITGVTNTTITGGGTVTSVTVNGTAGRVTSSGSPVTSSGIITLDLATTTVTPGVYTAANITVDAFGRITSAANGSGGGGGTVTSVGATGNNGITVAGSPITTSGSFTLGLGAITPTSVTASGTIGGSNLSGTNTGDQTITLTGDVSGSGTGSFATTLANSGVTANTYGSATQVPVFTVDSKGRITGVTNTTITGGGTVTSVSATGSSDITVGGSPITTSGTLTFALSNTTVTPGSYTLANITIDSKGRITAASNGSAGTGTVTSVGISGANGIGVASSPITTSGTIALSLGAITPSSVAATGTVTGSNLSGTNTGNQVIVLSGDATNSNTSTGGVLTLANTGVVAGSYTNTNITVDSKGRVTSISNGSGGSGTVTSTSVTSTADITGTVATPTTTPALSLLLTTTGVSAATYGSATQVPVFTVDSKGRISGVTNTTITAGSTAPEIVVWNYSSGGAGNLSAVDALFSQTSGVTTSVTDGPNSVVAYTFTGKSNPPKSITTYGQNFTTNTFAIKDTTSLSTASVVGGGTAAAPSIRTSFTATNVVTLQTTMANTGASAGIGQRAWLIVVFGF